MPVRPTDSQLTTQARRERDMLSISQGIRLDAWFKQSENGTGADGEPAKRAIKEWLPLLALGIETMLDSAGNRSTYATALKKLPPLTSAYIVLIRIMSNVVKERPFTTLARSIGQVVENETRLVDDDAMLKLFDKRTAGKSDFQRKAQFRKMMSARPEYTAWPEAKLVQVGGFLISAVESTLGIVHRREQVKRNRTTAVVVFNPEMMLELDGLAEELALDALDYWPMAIPPVPWTGQFGGGYMTREARRGMQLVRSHGRDENIEKLLEDADLDSVTAAVNAAQETPWKINADVFAAVAGIHADESGTPLKTLRKASDLARPEDGASKKEIADYFNKADSLRTKFRLAHRILSAAERFAGDDVLYFPHNMDWRGRVYPVCSGLSPQGNDLSLGLLTFATSRPLGEHGRKWLAIHGAGCYAKSFAGHDAGAPAIDKVSFADRALAIELQSGAICAVADSPETTRDYWEKADKPFQFLAFCFEWARVVRGATTTSLPVRMDATCSGIQHLSALSRDPATGAAVNLMDGDVPQDIYGVVAAALIEKMCELAVGTDEDALMARRWLDHGIDRKTAKRPTMTTPYGSTKRSAASNLRDDLWDSIVDKGEKPDVFRVEQEDDGAETDRPVRKSDHLTAAAQRPTPFLWEAISSAIPGARRTMDWIQSIAKGEKPDVFRVEQEDDGAETARPVRKSDHLTAAAQWLTPFLWEAIRSAIPGARMTMDWLQSIAKAASKVDKGIVWTTPDGFPVRQAYTKCESTRVRVAYLGKQVRMSVAHATEELDTNRQRNGAAPNFIHSLDAAALRMYVNRATVAGITDHGLIHDSFGTHAGDTETMQRLIRESFVELYSSDVTQVLRDYLASIGAEVPAPLDQGTLDISAVLDSSYFFS